MTPRKFIAANAREAMSKVRAAIGPDAVILANRKVEGGVEITALDEASLARWEQQTESVDQARTGSSNAEHVSTFETKAKRPAIPLADTASMSTVNFQRYANERRRKVVQPEHSGESGQSDRAPAGVADLGGQRSSASAGKHVGSEGAHSHPHGQANPSSQAIPASPEMDDVISELRQMRSFIRQQFSALSWVDGVRRTPAQARLLRQMLAACFSPQLARALVGSLPRDCSASASDQWLQNALTRNLQVACFEDGQLEQGGVFALVGPTGVGKTTSAAKIAAQCALRHGSHRVGLIGVDTYRVAAQDQLRRYGDLIGVDVVTVRDQRALLDALSRFADKHMVLIDTVGLGQRDPRVEGLLDGLALNALRRVIVVSAAAQAEAIDETLSAYQAEQASGVLLTKVDETCRLGGALDALIRYRVPLLAVGNGQRVPEDWQRPDAAALIAQALAVQEPDPERLNDLDLTLLMQRVEAPLGGEAHDAFGEIDA